MTGLWKSLAAAAVMTLAGAMAAQAAADGTTIGQREYQAGCAACHGADAAGNGPLSQKAGHKAPPLTQLQQANGGVFPFERVYRIIDGREQLREHGQRTMPVWAEKYVDEMQKGTEPFAGMSLSDEAIIRARILALIDYLAKLQQK